MKNIFIIILLSFIKSEAQNIQILEFSKGGNEPSISINPENNSQVLLAYNNNHVFKSSDTGKTFKKMKVTSKYGFYGDPVLYWGIGSNAYLAHLARNKKYNWPESFDRIVFQHIKFSKNKVCKSTGIGLNNNTFLPATPVSESVRPVFKMQDKPWFTVNRNSNDPHFGRIHMAWTQFDAYGSKKPGDSSRIRYAWSDNKGKTFSKPSTISRISGDAKDGDSTLEGATLCVDASGNTYCMWSGLDKLWFTQSADGGQNWDKPYEMGEHPHGWHMEVGGIMRANGMPFLVSLEKQLLAVWAANKDGISTVFYRFYSLNSKTWSSVRKISVGAAENAFMPQVCVQGGKAYIAFYTSSQVADKKSTYELKLNTALIDENNMDAQVNGSLIQGSQFMSEGKPFLGDYISICMLNQSGKEEAFIAYTTLIGNKDTYIALAKVKF